MRKRTFISVLLHLVFWAIVTFVFLRNSFLRPMAPSTWIECGILLIIVAAFYLSYFILVPQLLMRRRFILFYTTIIVLIFLSGFAELSIVKEEMIAIFNRIFPASEMPYILWTHFFFLSLRNACFVMAAVIVRLCEWQATQLQQNGKAILEKNHQILVNVNSTTTAAIGIEEIAYLRYENRKTIIVRKNAAKIATYASLSHFKDQLPPDEFIRINRNVLAAYSAIESYDETSVRVSANKGIKTLHIQKDGAEQIFDQLQQWNKDKYQYQLESEEG